MLIGGWYDGRMRGRYGARLSRMYRIVVTTEMKCSVRYATLMRMK